VIRFLFSFPWGTLSVSTSVAVITGVAIIGLGAPPMVLVPVMWGSMAIYRVVGTRFDRQLGGR